jgi:hypothetical protein
VLEVLMVMVAIGLFLLVLLVALTVLFYLPAVDVAVAE